MDNNNQFFNKPIVDIIENRRSVRTFKEEKLSQDVKFGLREFTDKLEGPFDAKVRFELMDDQGITEKTGGKIGTYGIIKGSPAYIASSVEKAQNSLEQLGYTFEKLMLYGESLGLGSCWLGGTFKRSVFEEAMDLKEDEMLPAVTPIGYPAPKKSVVESVMRTLAGSNNRKPWNELFFNQSFQNPLTESEAGQYKTALEMVRLGPSASNKQPWRIVKDGLNFHFYLQSAKGYSNALGFNIQKIDIGIAMCHFEMTARESGLEGTWEKVAQPIDNHGGIE
jgi:nitroreductase